MAAKKFTDEESKLLEQAVAVGRAMQHKFRPEPLYKLTGKGYMKSDGVSEVLKLKEDAKRDKGLAG